MRAAYSTGASTSTTSTKKVDKTVKQIGFKVEDVLTVATPTTNVEPTNKKNKKKTLRYVAVKIGTEFQEFYI